MFRLVVPTITLMLLVLSLEAVVYISTRNEFRAILSSSLHGYFGRVVQEDVEISK